MRLHVYAPAYTAGSGAGIRRVPKDGGAQEALDTCNTTWSLAVDDTTAFWITGACGGKARARRRPKNDIDAAVVESPIDDGTYSYATYGYAGLDATDIYWANAFQVRAIDKGLAGPMRTLLDTTNVRSRGLVVGDRVYAVFGEELVAIDEQSGAKVTLANGFPPNMSGSRVGLALDATHVYFADPDGKRMGRVPKAGGDVELVATDQAAPTGIALDDAFVYWSNAGDGSIWRRAR